MIDSKNNKDDLMIEEFLKDKATKEVNFDKHNGSCVLKQLSVILFVASLVGAFLLACTTQINAETYTLEKVFDVGIFICVIFSSGIVCSILYALAELIQKQHNIEKILTKIYQDK